MNIVKERRKQKAVCSNCQSPDYTMYNTLLSEGLTKPIFKCNSCGRLWQYGKDGGMYAQLATKIESGEKLFSTITETEI